MRRFKGFWTIFIFCSKLTWVKTIFFVQIRSPECENITFWVDLRQKIFSRFGGLKCLAGKIFEKMKSSLNPYISLFRRKCVDSGGFERFLFCCSKLTWVKTILFVQIRSPECENITFWVDLRKKFFQVWGNKNFSRFGGLKFLAGKIFEKIKSSLNPFISPFRQKCVDSGGFWAIFIFCSKLTWVKTIFFVQIRSPEH